MGIGLSEYRAAIGAFAWIASNANLSWRKKSKSRSKARELKELGGKERTERDGTSDLSNIQSRKRWRSLDGWRRRSISRDDGRRSKSLRRNRIKISLRSRSRSQCRSRDDNYEESADHFKNACISCKTKLFDKRWERGRASNKRWERGRIRRKTGEGSRETRSTKCCSLGEVGATNEEAWIESSQLFLLTCAAVSECLLIEQAIFTIIQMLLVRSGIETNPGPPTTSNPPQCCNAVQHFNRVKNTIAEVQNNFQSKVAQDTLTKQVIEVKETGNISVLVML